MLAKELARSSDDMRIHTNGVIAMDKDDVETHFKQFNHALFQKLDVIHLILFPQGTIPDDLFKTDLEELKSYYSNGRDWFYGIYSHIGLISSVHFRKISTSLSPETCDSSMATESSNLACTTDEQNKSPNEWLMRTTKVKELKIMLGVKEYFKIQTFVTVPACQGKGFGAKLLNFVKSLANEQGLPIYLEANTASKVFFQKGGFSELDSLILQASDFGDRSGRVGEMFFMRYNPQESSSSLCNDESASTNILDSK